MFLLCKMCCGIESFLALIFMVQQLCSLRSNGVGENQGGVNEIELQWA